MSAEVVRLPSAMTVEERNAERERKHAAEKQQITHDLFRLAELLRRQKARAARIEAKRVEEMVVPFKRPRRRRATKPQPPSGPRPAA